MLRDAIGRDWQCGTLQVDLNMPERLGAYYIDENSAKRTPVMLHRAMFGSLERFVAILLEHHAGRLPAWLAPVQAVVLSNHRPAGRVCPPCYGIPEKSGLSGRDRLAQREGGL